ncbi:MAG TPA: helix-turn-helix domain-containing protein [Caulobacteraceae bacterium]|jgi:hypothetical protein|nr:helix-turn-helix domain-containing protein [Caulobacteraceae bacterium]
MVAMAEKWGEGVAGRGFAQIPNYLLLLNNFLERDDRLKPVELLVLLQLVGTWWRKGELPFPSVSTLAVRCGTSTRQIQRALAHLESIGMLRRVKRRRQGIIASNAYDLEPLTEMLGEIAVTYPNDFPRRIRPATEAAATVIEDRPAKKPPVKKLRLIKRTAV